MEFFLVHGSKAEKNIMQYLLSNFPISALENLSIISSNCKISPATIRRSIIKLGFKNFPVFRETILKTIQQDHSSSPLARIQSEANEFTNTPIQYYKKNIINIIETFKQTDFSVLDKTVGILANPNKTIYCLGGRITGNLTSIFARYLKTIRLNVNEYIPYDGALVDMVMSCNKNSVLLITDIRRYDTHLLTLVKTIIKNKNVTIIVLTDIWGSPIKEYADISIPVYTGSDASWDSNVALLTMLEELMGRITAVLEEDVKKHLKKREKIIISLKNSPNI